MEKKSIPICHVHRTQLLSEEVLELKTVRGLESILEKTTLWPQLTVSNTLYFPLAICFWHHLETGAWARLSDHRSDKLQLSLYLVWHTIVDHILTSNWICKLYGYLHCYSISRLWPWTRIYWANVKYNVERLLANSSDAEIQYFLFYSSLQSHSSGIHTLTDVSLYINSNLRMAMRNLISCIKWASSLRHSLQNNPALWPLPVFCIQAEQEDKDSEVIWCQAWKASVWLLESATFTTKANNKVHLK